MALKDQQLIAIGVTGTTTLLRVASTPFLKIPPGKTFLVTQINSSVVPWKYETAEPIPYMKIFKGSEIAANLLHGTNDARAYSSSLQQIVLRSSDILNIIWGEFNGVTNYLAEATLLGSLTDL